MTERRINALETSAMTAAGSASFVPPGSRRSVASDSVTVAPGTDASVTLAPGTDASVTLAPGSDASVTISATGESARVGGPAELAAPPKTIGRYEIVRLIGAGGMGAVYEAMQDQPRRVVALKVMRATLASPSLLRRFEYESQLLARLRHPGIAQVYDAGMHRVAETEELVPYFAMEFIPDAVSLTAYARVHKLDRRARLELFQRVCDAVHHGHLRGVIHRDLKPANILVDTSGQPKIIDFGVAYSSDSEAAVVTEGEERAPLVGTLQYMAPEQCAMDATDIDARADVFALGLILYELLTERTAYSLSGKRLGEVLQIVREASFARASSLDASLRGDVDAIIHKAAAKDRTQRYESPAALSADIGHFLRYEPITARSISVVGRMSRWVRRNQRVAAVGAASLAILVIVSVVLIGQILAETRRANNNLKIAQQNLSAANQNFALIKGLFTSMRPNDQQKGLVDLVQLLDGAVHRLEEKPPDLPATEADFREFLAEGYRGLGLYAKSIAEQRRVVALRRDLYPDPSQELANSVHALAAGLWWNGQYDEAGQLYEQSLDMRRRLFGARHADIATSLTHLGAFRLRQGRFSEAESLYQQALDMRQSMPETPRDQMAASLNNLAKAIQLRGQYDRAEQLFRRAHAMVVEAVGEKDLQTANAANNLALCLLEAKKPAEAERFMRQAVEIRAARYRDTHHLVNLSRLGLARAKFDQSPGPEAVALAEAATTALKAALPAGHPDVVESLTVVGRMRMQLGDATGAEGYFRRALDELGASSQAAPRERAMARLYMSECLRELKKFDEARTLLEEGVVLLSGSPDLLELQSRLRSMAGTMSAGQP